MRSLLNRGDTVERTDDDDGRTHLTTRFTASLSLSPSYEQTLFFSEQNANALKRYALLTIEARSDNDDGTRAREREQGDRLQEREGREERETDG